MALGSHGQHPRIVYQDTRYVGKDWWGLDKERGGVWTNSILTRLVFGYEQTRLGLYIGNMLNSIKGASKDLEACLELAGQAKFFPSAPVVTT